MSVLIKGMEMPETCDDCPVGWCNNLILFSESDKRADNCPLVEVPEPHGRLIDADEICFSMTNGIDQDIAEEAIRESPTVIEAEGE